MFLCGIMAYENKRMERDMRVTVIDGQGGQLGAQIVKEITAQMPDIRVMAIGTNTIATSAMLKAGAENAATGENAVLVACRKSDVIIGPIGIVIADSLFGEITATMAAAVGRADAIRILIPMNKCENQIAGVPNLNTKALIQDALAKLQVILDRENS